MRDLENNFLKPLQEWPQTQMPRNSGNKDISAPCLGQLLLGWLVATREYKATIARSSVGFFFFSFSREARNPDFYVKSHYLEMLATN